MDTGGSSVPEAEALERFRLLERLRRYRGDTLPSPDESVRVVNGDLHLEGDLILDELDAAGMIVEGDLDVAGNVISDSDPGPFLLVSGRLRARNVVAGGAEIHIEGDADIENVLLGHDMNSGGCAREDEGRVSIDGTTRARLIINESHEMDLDTKSPYWHKDFEPVGMPLSDHLHQDIPIERNDEEYGVVLERVNPWHLLVRIRAGQSVLRDPDDPRPRKSYAQWLADCEKHGQVLEYVPRELVDPAICLAAVRNDGRALRFVPRELVTAELCDAALAKNPYAFSSMPAEFRTPERCRVAVEHQGRLLARVPVELRTPELCARAIERDHRVYEVMRSIPEEHLTPELCLRAAQRDGLSLGEMPARFRTFDVCVAALDENLFVLNDIPEAIREQVVKKVRGEPVEISPEVHALLEGPRPSKLRLFLWLTFGAHRPGKSGLLGFFERRPTLTVLLRALVSVLMLSVHAWLTVHVWRTEGLWPGVATLAALFLSELYWAWQMGVTALSILSVCGVVLYWMVEIAFRKLSKRWRATETNSTDGA